MQFMVRYFVTISYMGTKYRGSQRNLDFPNGTIQGVIENALCSLDTLNNPLTSFASRTDKGVHAFMNAFHVDLEHKKLGEVYIPSIIKRQLNCILRETNHDIIIKNVTAVPQTFHVRHCAKWRSYVYRLAILKPEIQDMFFNTKTWEEYLPISLLNRCHVVPSTLQIDTVQQVLNLYCGSHDFTTFTKYMVRDPWKCAKRTIEEFKFYEIPISSYDYSKECSNISLWEFYVKSSSFLYHQIRKLVGTALAAGFGSMQLSDVEDMLQNPKPDHRVKSPLAPACGLYLSNIQYDKEGFQEVSL